MKPCSLHTALFVLEARGPFCAINLDGARCVYYWRFREEDSAPMWCHDEIEDVEDSDMAASYREVGLGLMLGGGL